MKYLCTVGICLFFGSFWMAARGGGDKTDSGFVVDRAKKTITIDAKIAPRKLPHLKGEIYPIEVIASWAYPKGKKAHETIVTFEALPSKIHKALEDLGLKAGKPVMGDADTPPQGPAVKVYLDLPSPGGTKRIPIDRALVDKRTGRPFPRDVQWRFTGSVQVQPDPTKKDKVYGADTSGTLAVIFPVSDQTVFQTNLTLKYERFMKLEANAKVLPPEGTPVKLVLEVSAK